MKNKASICVHTGTFQDKTTGGMNTPIFTSSAYDYRNGTVVYPRYFNTINQDAVIQKIAALEHGETGIIYSSGMAAIFTAFMGILEPGDHIIFQNNLYGGTHHLVVNELPRFGIEYSLVDGNSLKAFAAAIRSNTKAIFIETPANPLLDIIDIAGVANIAKAHNLITFIDNTFASPINQNPINLGIDIVLHSGTKYLGGHSDIVFGAMVSSEALTQKIKSKSTIYGGSLNGQTCYLIERSIKTLNVRVQQQNKNALALAEFLEQHAGVKKVNYPGLINHPNHDIAKRQMNGFGGMLSFELKVDHHSEVDLFLDHLKMIRTAVSLGGVETSICSPYLTSHAKVSDIERTKMGITRELLRVSVGIEDIKDLKQAMEVAFDKMKKSYLLA